MSLARSREACVPSLQSQHPLARSNLYGTAGATGPGNIYWDSYRRGVRVA